MNLYEKENKFLISGKHQPNKMVKHTQAILRQQFVRPFNGFLLGFFV